jgi:hypothetical protein
MFLPIMRVLTHATNIPPLRGSNRQERFQSTTTFILDSSQEREKMPPNQFFFDSIWRRLAPEGPLRIAQ